MASRSCARIIRSKMFVAPLASAMLSAVPLLLFLNVAQIIIQTIEALGPKSPVVRHPIGDVLKRKRHGGKHGRS